MKDSDLTINLKEKEKLCLLTILSMRENEKMAANMEKESIKMQLKINILEIIRTIN